MLRPLFVGTHHAAGAAGREDGLFQFKRVAPCDGLDHGLAFFWNAEHLHGGCTVMRKIRMHVIPAAILGREHAHHAGLGRLGLVADLDVTGAAQRRGGMARVQRNALAAAGAQFPQVIDGKADRRQGGHAGLGDAKRRGQYRVHGAGDVEFTQAVRRPAEHRQQGVQSLVHPLLL
jgi:hypothetical protein